MSSPRIDGAAPLRLRWLAVALATALILASLFAALPHQPTTR